MQHGLGSGWPRSTKENNKFPLSLSVNPFRTDLLTGVGTLRSGAGGGGARVILSTSHRPSVWVLRDSGVGISGPRVWPGTQSVTPFYEISWLSGGRPTGVGRTPLGHTGPHRPSTENRSVTWLHIPSPRNKEPRLRTPSDPIPALSREESMVYPS